MSTSQTFLAPRSRVDETHREMRKELLERITPILFGKPSNGAEARAEFEGAFAEMTQQGFACAVHSGTIGLFLALQACGVQPGDEVITVGNSDISTTAAISQCGATPILCDVLESDYTIDVSKMEQLINKRTKAILPVDLYGHPSDVKSLRELADRSGLYIVEDAALATGARDYGVPVGHFADAAIFSFASFKPLGCLGNGAVVTTSDTQIAEQLRLLSGYGHEVEKPTLPAGHQYHVAEGYNVPLDPFQAAVLSAKLPHVAEWTKKRQAIAAQYEEGLRRTAASLPCLRPDSEPTFRSYTILVDRQEKIYQQLRERGVEVVLHYTPPVYQQAVYSSSNLSQLSLPVTERLAQHLLCLPVTVEFDDKDIAFVIDEVRDAIASN
jgi:dTDP-4-amino-4,6-dideoxygalactose transaminase